MQDVWEGKFQDRDCKDSVLNVNMRHSDSKIFSAIWKDNKKLGLWYFETPSSLWQNQDYETHVLYNK